MMFMFLSLWTQYYLYTRLRKEKCSKFFAAWCILITAAGYISGYDLDKAEYDILPLHVSEILYGIFATWTIITLLAFGSFLLFEFLPVKRKKFCAVILTVLLTIYSIIEAYSVTRRDITITTSKLPEGVDKIRLAYITDEHIGGLNTYWHLERVMSIIKEADPDIFIMTGDIIDGDMSYRQRELELLSQAAKNAHLGAFAVNGNHEYNWLLDEDVESIIRNCGFNLLVFERVEVAGLTIIGLDDVPYGYLKPYLTPEDKERFVMVLKHRPGLPVDAEGNFDLQLSGHTHGGQFWPLGYFKNMRWDSVQGLSQKAGGYVYVSNGSGFNGAMMRLFVPPEVTVIDIVRE